MLYVSESYFLLLHSPPPFTEAFKASLSAVLKHQNSPQLLHISGACLGDESHYNGYKKLFTGAPVSYHIKYAYK